MNEDLAAFWQWFSGEQQRLHIMAAESPGNLVDEVNSELGTLGLPLSCEVGVGPEEPIELIFSADGARTNFSLARALVKLAPSSDSWAFIPLKPPRGFDFKTDYEGLEIDPRDLWFLPLDVNDHPDLLGIRIGIPGLEGTEDPDMLLDACWMVLDTALGEESATVDLAHVDCTELPANPTSSGFMVLTELPEFIRWRKRSGRCPS